MNKKSDALLNDFLYELNKQLTAREIRPLDGPHPTPAQKIADMVEGMLLEEDLIPAMFCKFMDFTLRPRPDYGEKIKAAKKAGTLQQVEIRLAGEAPEVVN